MHKNKATLKSFRDNYTSTTCGLSKIDPPMNSLKSYPLSTKVWKISICMYKSHV